MKNRHNVVEQLAKVTDLPLEPLPGIPLIEVAGEGRVLIENHCGVMAYGCEQICVKVNYGHISICGRRLKLDRMTKHQLVITGDVDGISLVRRTV